MASPLPLSPAGEGCPDRTLNGFVWSRVLIFPRYFSKNGFVPSFFCFCQANDLTPAPLPSRRGVPGQNIKWLCLVTGFGISRCFLKNGFVPSFFVFAELMASSLPLSPAGEGCPDRTLNGFVWSHVLVFPDVFSKMALFRHFFIFLYSSFTSKWVCLVACFGISRCFLKNGFVSSFFYFFIQ